MAVAGSYRAGQGPAVEHQWLSTGCCRSHRLCRRGALWSDLPQDDWRHPSGLAEGPARIGRLARSVLNEFRFFTGLALRARLKLAGKIDHNYLFFRDDGAESDFASA